MPYGGDPVKELGPYALKGCAVLAGVGILALVAVGALLGKVF